MFKKWIVRNKILSVIKYNKKDKYLIVYDCNNGIEEQTHYGVYLEDIDKNNLEEWFPKEYLNRYAAIYRNNSNTGIIVIGVDLIE